MQRRTRVAGWIYIALACVAPLRLIIIPGRLITPDDQATASRIASNAMLFRVGMAADVLTAVLLLGVTLAVYRVFEEVDRNQARLVVVLGGLLPVPIYCLNVLNDVAVLRLASGSVSIAGFSEVQRASLMRLFLDLHRHGVLVNEVFWGLWLLPFGWLLIKSAAFPRLLGWLLYVNGAAYIALSATGLLFPDVATTLSRVLAPATMGEVLVMLWFVVRGARRVEV